MTRKRQPKPKRRSVSRTLEITERFGVFEFATTEQLILVRMLLELMPKAMRKKYDENFVMTCAEIGAQHLLAGAYIATSAERITAAAERAKKAIDKEYKPSRPPTKGKPKRRRIRRSK